MTAKEYKVKHPYGATYTPWSLFYSHRGNDRPTPSGTPIDIAGVTIGLTGNTGRSTGAHLHTQAGTDAAVQQTINPTPYEFQEGTVVGTRSTDTGDWGKYVKIKVGNIYVVYAHLSEVKVSVGQVIKGEDEMIKDTDNEYGRWNKLGFQIRGRNLTRSEFRKSAVGLTWLRAMEILSDNPEADRAFAYQVQGVEVPRLKEEIAKRDKLIAEIQKKAELSDSLQKKIEQLESDKTKDTETGNAFVRWIGNMFRKG